MTFLAGTRASLFEEYKVCINFETFQTQSGINFGNLQYISGYKAVKAAQ